MYPPFFGCPGEGKYSKPSIFRQRLAILRKDVYRKQVLAANLKIDAVINQMLIDTGLSPAWVEISPLITNTSRPDITPTAQDYEDYLKEKDWPAGPREGDVVLFDELDTIARKYGLI